MKPETSAHAEQRKNILDLIAAQGLDQYRDALSALIKPAIALTSREATPDDLALGASRLGGGRRAVPRVVSTSRRSSSSPPHSSAFVGVEGL